MQNGKISRKSLNYASLKQPYTFHVYHSTALTPNYNVNTNAFESSIYNVIQDSFHSTYDDTTEINISTLAKLFADYPFILSSSLIRAKMQKYV